MSIPGPFNCKEEGVPLAQASPPQSDFLLQTRAERDEGLSAHDRALLEGKNTAVTPPEISNVRKPLKS